jgi:uncharacterized membrane protein
MSRRLWICLAIAAACVAAPSPSLADFNVCNRTSAKEIYVAIGLYRGGSGWESVGWYTIARNKCATLVNKLGDRYYYVYAEGDNKTIWDGQDDKQGTNFCVQNGKEFVLNVAKLADKGDNPNCEKHGFVTHRFLRVDTERYDNYNFDIAD